jgi:cysteinyl-tRNA synthetase
MTIRVYNTLTRKKEDFEPLRGRRVSMFVCGITPYDYTHLGHAKTYVQFDTIVKYLRHRGYHVFYLQNVTDVDDHIINRAAETGEDPLELAERFFASYLEDMDALWVDSVSLYAHATDYIPEIIEQVQGLIEKGHAYQVDGDVFYSVESFDGWGRLSGQKMEELEAGARVEVDERKRNPADFALWKSQKPGEPAWDSPWGRGRPGWHIEDTAITITHFGPQYDIHVGATELMFPHHEAEIAQAEAFTGVSPFVKYWMHGGLLNVQGEKMAKSLGNFWTVKDALKEYEAEVLRFFLLYAHYRKPVDLTREALDEARTGYERLRETVNRLRERMPPGEGEPSPEDEFAKAVREAEEAFHAAMDDDFNTREAMAALFTLAGEANKALGDGSAEGASLAAALRFFETAGSILGLFRKGAGVSREDVGPLVEMLIQQRELARLAGDFETADRIRDELSRWGVALEDTQEGPRWKFR